MAKHRWHKCKDPQCPGCHFCLGGLAMCRVCGQAEAELTEQCPGPTWRPALGQWVRASDRIKKVVDPEGKKLWYEKRGLNVPPYSWHGNFFEHWVRREEQYPDMKSWGAKPVEGIYVGSRTISNGYTEVLDCEYGSRAWIPTEHFECWLIVPSDRQNPIRVFPEDVQIVERTD